MRCVEHAYEMWVTLRLDKVYCNEHVSRGVMLIRVQDKIGGSDVSVLYVVRNGGVEFRYDDVIMWTEPSMCGVNDQMVSLDIWYTIVGWNVDIRCGSCGRVRWRGLGEGRLRK